METALTEKSPNHSASLGYFAVPQCTVLTVLRNRQWFSMILVSIYVYDFKRRH